jgi:hypothetical protein
MAALSANSINGIWTDQIIKHIFEIPDFKEFQQKYTETQWELRLFLDQATYNIIDRIKVAIQEFPQYSYNDLELWICLIDFDYICHITDNNTSLISKYLWVCKQHASKYFDLYANSIKRFIVNYRIDFNIPTLWTLPETFLSQCEHHVIEKLVRNVDKFEDCDLQFRYIPKTPDNHNITEERQLHLLDRFICRHWVMGTNRDEIYSMVVHNIIDSDIVRLKAENIITILRRIRPHAYFKLDRNEQSINDLIARVTQELERQEKKYVDDGVDFK